jgi:hypothetical protein
VAHADYFAALAERVDSHFATSDEPTWVMLLVREHDNVRAALAYSARSPLQLRLVAALWGFWMQQGHYTEGRRWLRGALAYRENAPPEHIARALLATAVLARHQGDFEDAEEAANESVAIAQTAGLRTLEARALGTLSNIALAQHDVPHAAELLARTDVLLRELGDDKRLAITVANRSYLALQAGDFPTAYALASEGRSLSRETGDLANVVTADLNLSLGSALRLADTRCLGKRSWRRSS